MSRLLADNDAEGHVAILVRVLMSETWIAFWNDLELTVVRLKTWDSAVMLGTMKCGGLVNANKSF